MAQPNSLTALYAELNRFGQKEEYDKAVRTANKILHSNPQEFEAFNCKVVSQILLDRFDDALNFLNRDKHHTGTLKFEKAYCEYRLNRTREALATLRSVTNQTTRTKELLCQVLYRIEEYEECYSVYRDLIKNSQDDFDGERETNMAAVIASLQLWGVKDVDDPGLEETSYELCYNNACYYIGTGDYVTARAKLKKAEDMLRADTDLAEDELEEELAIIRVQRGYMLQTESKHDEASHLYNQVMKTKPSDLGLLAVVSNNVVTVNKDQNIFDSKKKMKAATSDTVKHKTVSAQRRNIRFNQCLLHMYSNQADQCHSLANLLAPEFSNDTDSPQLIQIAQYVRDKKVDNAVTSLRELAKSNPNLQVKTHLILAQLYLSQGNISNACDTLKALGDAAYSPGIVSTLVMLYMAQDDMQAASKVLIDAVNWYKKNAPKSENVLLLTNANADFQLKNGQAEEAAKMLEDLYKINPRDPLVVAQLISSYAKLNSSKVKTISKDLPPVKDIIRDVDIDALEASFSTLGPKYMKKQQAHKGETSPASPGSPSPTVAGAGDSLMMKKKQRKKKKGKLPKECTPGVGIDTERWLPRRERSYFRGKRKAKGKEVGKGTQGLSAVTAAIADSLDASKTSPSQQAHQSPKAAGGAAAASPSPQATPLPTQPGPRQQKPTQAATKKKKKGKGGKW